MKYLDIYKNCIGCPVSKYCGTMVNSIRLCNSYRTKEEKELIKEIHEKDITPISITLINLIDNCYAK